MKPALRRLTRSAALSVALSGAALAHANLLTFDGAICGGGQACGNFGVIDATYGDVAGLIDVQSTYNVLDPQGAGNSVQHWDIGYSDLTNVAFGGGSDTTGVAEIFLKPAAGQQVHLTGFDLGAWPNTNRSTQVTILDGLGATLFSSGNFVVSGATHSHLGFDLASSSGLRIQWGPSAFNVGIDNVAFEVSAVPEPETWALLIAGLGMIGALKARRAARP